jgi:hypothetical protein
MRQLFMNAQQNMDMIGHYYVSVYLYGACIFVGGYSLYFFAYHLSIRRKDDFLSDQLSQQGLPIFRIHG